MSFFTNFDFASQSEQTDPSSAGSGDFDRTTTAPSAFDLAGINIRSQNEGPWVPHSGLQFPISFSPVDYGSSASKAHTVADGVNLQYGQRPLFLSRPSLTNSSSRDSGFHSLLDGPETVLYPSASAYTQEYLTPKAPPGPTSTKSAPVNRRKRPRSQYEELHCPEEGCKKVLKSNSELTKHKQQHDRTHHCGVPGCGRTEGFGTANDLDRHQFSVHKMPRRLGHGKEYECAECRRTTHGDLKVWDRKDNFKSHITRRHPGIDPDSVIARSERHTPMYSHDSAFGGSQNTEGQGYQDLLTPMSTSRSATMSQDTSYSNEMGESNFSQSHSDTFAHIGSGQTNGHVSFGATLSPSGPRVDRRSFSQRIPRITTTGSQVGPIDYGEPILSPCYSTPDMSLLVFNDVYAVSERLGSAQSDSCNVQPQEAACQTEDPKSEGGYKCSVLGCNKIWPRQCDLRKHHKRHSRPYGCTFLPCAMALGSRNDWKRHESSQHQLKEMWWCSSCRRTFEKHQDFAFHLEESHGIPLATEDNVRTCNKMHLGPNAHFNFWCGFCNRLISQEENLQIETGSTMSAFDFRFKHIGDHYDGEKRSIESWILPEQFVLETEMSINRNTVPIIRSDIRATDHEKNSAVNEFGALRAQFEEPQRQIRPPGRPMMSYDSKRRMERKTARFNVPAQYNDMDDAEGEDDNGY